MGAVIHWIMRSYFKIMLESQEEQVSQCKPNTYVVSV